MLIWLSLLSRQRLRVQKFRRGLPAHHVELRYSNPGAPDNEWHYLALVCKSSLLCRTTLPLTLGVGGGSFRIPQGKGILPRG